MVYYLVPVAMKMGIGRRPCSFNLCSGHNDVAAEYDEVIKMAKVELKYINSYVTVDVPDRNLLAVLNPEDFPGVSDPLQEVKNALMNPIESLPLKELAKGKKNVVILASDITRPSPSHILIPPIVEELIEAGVNCENILVIFGLGYHRKHTEEEKKQLVGESVYNLANVSIFCSVCERFLTHFCSPGIIV